MTNVESLFIEEAFVYSGRIKLRIDQLWTSGLCWENKNLDKQILLKIGDLIPLDKPISRQTNPTFNINRFSTRGSFGFNSETE